MFTHLLQRFPAACGGKYAIAGLSQDAAKQAEKAFLVIHHKNCFRATNQYLPHYLGLRVACGWALDARKIHIKGSAMIRFTFNADVSSCVVDDSVNRRQAKAGSFAVLLRGKEWIEDPCFDIRPHANPRVTHSQTDKSPQLARRGRLRPPVFLQLS